MSQSSSNSTTTSNSSSVDRELPDEQYQLDEDADLDEGEIQTMEQAMRISERFEHIKDHTVDDGLVLGTVKEINTSPGNNRLVISIEIPAEDHPEQFRFKKPKVWSEKYRFVRWVREYGYDAESFPNMIEDKCRVKVENIQDSEDYELYVPEHGYAILEQPKRVYEWYTDVNGPIVAFLAFVLVTVAVTAELGGLLTTGFGVGQGIALTVIAIIGVVLGGMAELELKDE